MFRVKQNFFVTFSREYQKYFKLLYNKLYLVTDLVTVFYFNADNVIFPTIINGNKARNIATNSTHKATSPITLPTLRQIFFLVLLLIFISQCRCYHLQRCSC